MRPGFRFPDRRRALGLALASIGLAALGGLSVSLLVARRLTARAAPISAERTPELAWTRALEVRLRTADGYELGATWCPLSDASPAAVVLHGNGGSRSGLLPQATALAELGCASLLVTLRAHGDSEGDRNDFGRGARADVIAAVEWLRARRPARRVFVVGSSLGGAAALLAAGELGTRVEGYVIECPYRDLASAARNRLAMHLPEVLDQLAYAGLRTAGALLEPGLLDLSLERTAAALAGTLRVLVFCAGRDQHATCAEAEAVARALGDGARLVVFPAADHDRCLLSDPALWRAELGLLLARSAEQR